MREREREGGGKGGRERKCKIMPNDYERGLIKATHAGPSPSLPLDFLFHLLLLSKSFPAPASAVVSTHQRK